MPRRIRRREVSRAFKAHQEGAWVPAGYRYLGGSEARSIMNVVDSSGWLEYFANGHNADFFAAAIENTPELLVPTLSLYEVFKRVLQQRGEGDALQAVAVMMQGRVVDLDTDLALRAARVSIAFKLPMADSVMLAAAQMHEATLWTQDADLKGIPGVEYIATS